VEVGSRFLCKSAATRAFAGGSGAHQASLLSRERRGDAGEALPPVTALRNCVDRALLVTAKRPP